MKKANSTNIKFYNILTLIFIFCLFASNMGGIKIINVMGMAQVSAGILFFPLLYLLNGIVTEIYGFSAGLRVVWCALFSNLIFTILMYLITLLPEGPDWQEQAAFELIFDLSLKITINALTSYFFGQLINAMIMATLKIQFQGRLFALRAIFSTLIAAFLDSVLFCTIILYTKMTFYGIKPDDEIIKMAMMLTIIKVLYTIIMLPFSIRLIAYLKKSENLDIYEKPSFKSIFPSCRTNN